MVQWRNTTLSQLIIYTTDIHVNIS